MSRESITPVQYFAFAGPSIVPSSFISLKVFTFELIRSLEKVEPRAPKITVATNSVKRRKEIIIESQILPVLNRKAENPRDFYQLFLMFPEKVVEEAEKYDGPIDKSLEEYENVKVRNLINGLLRILDPTPTFVLKSLKAFVGTLDNLAIDKVKVLILILFLMINDWEMQLNKIPLKEKRLKEFLLLIGCRFVDGTAVLCKTPQFEIKKRLFN